jgi:uncharacterized protein YbjT (DUF2867 family)
MTPNILITGATGNVGLETLHALPNLQAVRAAVRSPERAQAILPDTLGDCVRFDFTEPNTFAAALDNITHVFLVRPPQLSNVERDMQPFINAMQVAGVQQVVFLSVMGAEDVSFIPHAKIEKALQDSGLTWTFLRPGFFNQNLSTTHAADIRERNEVFVPAGKGRTSFIDVRDIGAIAARTLTEEDHTEKAYTLTGNESLTYDEVAEILSDVLERDIQYTRPNPARFGWHTWREGVSIPQTLVMIGIYLPTYFNRTGSLTHTVQHLLGRPPISFKQFAKDNRQVWT